MEENSMKNGKLVLLCGAGFPIMWGSPTSDFLTKTIKNIVQEELRDNISLSDKLINNDSFETILAAIESLLYYRIDNFNYSYLASFFKCTKEIDIDSLWEIYKNCINAIIHEVEKYENRVLQDKNKRMSIVSFWNVLSKKFESINYYTTNYDEILPYIIKSKDSCIEATKSNNKEQFFNLHGSIHLCKEWNGQSYDIKHKDVTCYLNNALLIDGGNPNEVLLFSPIITGRNKTQRLMDKHFNRSFVAFANDLSECGVLIIIGYSFSDPHINMLIKEYTSFDETRVIVIDKLPNVCESPLFNRLIQLIPIQSQYTPDNSCDDWFSYNNSTVKVYKRGCESLFHNISFINNL